MSHLGVFLSLSAGVAFYGIMKHFLGFEVDAKELFSSIYWMAIALLVHNYFPEKEMKR